MNTKEKILELLSDMHPEIDDFEAITDLVHGGTLDSLNIVMLIAQLNDEFDIGGISCITTTINGLYSVVTSVDVH